MQFQDAEGRPLERDLFDFQIPEVEGTAAVVLTRDGLVLAEWVKSPNAPHAWVSEIAGPVEAPLPVHWLGEDLDGDPVTLTVLYSPDGGRRWVPAASEGRVERLLLQPGVVVQADSVVMELFNPELEMQALDALQQQRAAEAALAELKVRLESQRLDQEAAAARVWRY